MCPDNIAFQLSSRLAPPLTPDGKKALKHAGVVRANSRATLERNYPLAGSSGLESCLGRLDRVLDGKYSFGRFLDTSKAPPIHIQ